MKKYCLLLFAILTILSSCQKPGINQWRGPKRDGQYAEKNLLKQWPENGPSLLWEYEGIENGYGSPIITDKMIYITGEADSINFLFALSLDGKFEWKSEAGNEWITNFRGSRSTPTFVDQEIYTCSGLGEIYCFDASSGEKKWSKNMIRDLNGKMNRFGYSQSLMVDMEKVYCSPGGADTNIVALHRKTGDLLWVSPAKHEISAYCSPLLIEQGKQKLLLTFSEHQLLALDPSNGELIWSHEQDTVCDIHANTPLFDNGNIYYTTGCGNMTEKLKLSENGKSVMPMWKNASFDNYMGGVIKSGNSLITTGARKKFLKRIDCETGLITDSLKLGTGAVISADNMIYLYNEKGDMHLIDPSGQEMKVISQFKIEKGTNEHFAHPVICNGILYVRRGNYLAAYNIRNS